MKKLRVKGSYTIEASIYIPFILFLVFHSMNISIGYFQAVKENALYEELEKMDSVKEFYIYQMMEEVGKELEDGAG